MKELNFSNSLLAAGCCVVTASLFGCTDKEASKPNMIIVLADDQGWGDMAYYGHPVLQTPNFDDMANSGLRFDRFYAAAPVSSPTRGSILTGRHPNRFGCFTWGHTLRPQETTLARALKTAGYVSAHFGKWHLGPVYQDSPVNPGASGFDEWVSAPNFFENDPIFSNQGIAVQLEGESSIVTVDEALRFIREHKDGSRPFFAFVCFGSPHLPHIADEQDRVLYLDQEERLQHFYGEITGMDRAVGKLREELRSMNIHENTIVWYLSDNGGLREFGSTGGREFKGSIYEGGIRVPAILEWPARIKKPLVTNIPSNTSDIYPTLLEIAGVNLNDQPVLDGVSLVQLIDNTMNRREEPMGFWNYPEGGNRVPSHELMLELLQMQQAGNMEVDPSILHLDAGDISRQFPCDHFPGHAAWLDWPYKLHRINGDRNDTVLELYNLEEDPYEENNLVKMDASRVRSMSKQLKDWQVSVIRSLNGEDYR